MKFCTKCIMPDTRPHITFDSKGICIACQNHEKKKSVNWDARFEELKVLCDKYRRKNEGLYYCCFGWKGQSLSGSCHERTYGNESTSYYCGRFLYYD